MAPAHAAPVLGRHPPHGPSCGLGPGLGSRGGRGHAPSGRTNSSTGSRSFVEQVGSGDRATAVDARLLLSAAERVHWELDVLQPWRTNPLFYVDQTVGVLFDLLVVPAPDAGRLSQVVAVLHGFPSTVAAARHNLDGCEDEFLRLALDSLVAGCRGRPRGRAAPGPTPRRRSRPGRRSARRGSSRRGCPHRSAEPARHHPHPTVGPRRPRVLPVVPQPCRAGPAHPGRDRRHRLPRALPGHGPGGGPPRTRRPGRRACRGVPLRHPRRAGGRRRARRARGPRLLPPRRPARHPGGSGALQHPADACLPRADRLGGYRRRPHEHRAQRRPRVGLLPAPGRRPALLLPRERRRPADRPGPRGLPPPAAGPQPSPPAPRAALLLRQHPGGGHRVLQRGAARSRRGCSTTASARARSSRT